MKALVKALQESGFCKFSPRLSRSMDFGEVSEKNFASDQLTRKRLTEGKQQGQGAGQRYNLAQSMTLMRHTILRNYTFCISFRVNTQSFALKVKQ